MLASDLRTSSLARLLNPKALDAVLGQTTARLVAALAKGGVIAIDGNFAQVRLRQAVVSAALRGSTAGAPCQALRRELAEAEPLLDNP